MNIDRGDYDAGVTPWDDAAWQAEVLEWTRDTLGDDAVVAAVRLRPWSVLARLETAVSGDVWFKANPEGSRFEAALGEGLARWVPDRVLTPMAVRPERGWALWPDGGQVLAEAELTVWEELLRQYATLQRELIPHVPEMKHLGVPSAAPEGLPALFTRLVDENPTLLPEERTQLLAKLPLLTSWCEELSTTTPTIPLSLDHSDLQPSQILSTPPPHRFTFFDWGDATLAHPFTSLLVPTRIATRHHGPSAAPRLRAAYLTPWTDTGLSLPALHRAADLAHRLGAVGRAAAWTHVFPTEQGVPLENLKASAAWLHELFAGEPD